MEPPPRCAVGAQLDHVSLGEVADDNTRFYALPRRISSARERNASIDHALDTPEMVNDWDVLSPFCSYKKNTEPSPTDTEGGEEPSVGDNDGDAGGEDDALHNKWRITSMMLSFAELVFAVFGIHHSFDDLYLGVQLASAYLRARRTTFKTFAELVSLRTEWQAEEDEEDEAIESKMEKSASKDGETRTQIESRMFARLRRRHHGVYFNSILLKCLQKEMDLYDAECTRYLAVIQTQKPYVLAAVKSEQVAAAMLFAQSETLEELYHEGMVSKRPRREQLFISSVVHVCRRRCCCPCPSLWARSRR